MVSRMAQVFLRHAFPNHEYRNRQAGMRRCRVRTETLDAWETPARTGDQSGIDPLPSLYESSQLPPLISMT